MHVQQSGSFLWQIRQPWFPMNAYLLQEADGFTLIDTLMSARNAEAIAACAENLGGKIQRIVLTHGHMDHIGGLSRLIQLLPHAAVLIGAREARLIAGDMTLSAAENTHPLRGSYPVVRVSPTTLLHHDDRIQSLRVIATPGHSPGHLSFLDTRDGTLVTGDAVHTVGGISVTSEFTWRFPLPYTATWNPVAARASAQLLADAHLTRIAPGHGPVIEEPTAALIAAIQRAP